MPASRALLASQKQGRSAELHDAVLKLREEPTEPVLKREAERAGLDWARLKRDMDDPAAQRRLDANLALGLPADARDYGIGAQILRALGVGKMQLLANPRKMPSMTGFDLEVTGYVPRLDA